MKTDYKKGDIVVWMGIDPSIIRLDERIENNDFPNDYLWNNHSKLMMLSFNNLRPATEAEIKLLGSDNICEIPQSEYPFETRDRRRYNLQKYMTPGWGDPKKPGGWKWWKFKLKENEKSETRSHEKA